MVFLNGLKLNNKNKYWVYKSKILICNIKECNWKQKMFEENFDELGKLCKLDDREQKRVSQS